MFKWIKHKNNTGYFQTEDEYQKTISRFLSQYIVVKQQDIFLRV